MLQFQSDSQLNESNIKIIDIFKKSHYNEPITLMTQLGKKRSLYLRGQSLYLHLENNPLSPYFLATLLFYLVLCSSTNVTLLISLQPMFFVPVPQFSKITFLTLLNSLTLLSFSAIREAFSSWKPCLKF